MSMLLKFQNSVCNKQAVYYLIIVCINFLIFTAQAQDTTQNKWQIHGFIAQGLMGVNDSSFVNDDGKISAELTEVGINGSYKLNDSVRLTGQLVYLDGGNRYVKGARVDYALIDLEVFQNDQWLVNLYLGRFKNNNWLYSSTRDIPHARPSIVLPQSKYFDGFRDIAMGSDGVSAKVVYSHDDYGDFDFYLNYGSSSLETKDIKLLLGDSIKGTGKQDFDAQASLYWQPQLSSWQFGVSILDSDFQYQHSAQEYFSDAFYSFQQVNFITLYEGENWEFSSELFQSKFTQKGFYSDNFINVSTGVGAYLQSIYYYDNKLSILARVEKYYANKNDKNGSKLEKSTAGAIPHYFGYQNDVTIGVTYQLAETMRIQVEHHWVQGTSRLTPIVMPNVEINDQERWNMWALQLMYWF